MPQKRVNFYLYFHAVSSHYTICCCSFRHIQCITGDYVLSRPFFANFGMNFFLLYNAPKKKDCRDTRGYPWIPEDTRGYPQISVDPRATKQIGVRINFLVPGTDFCEKRKKKDFCEKRKKNTPSIQLIAYRYPVITHRYPVVSIGHP